MRKYLTITLAVLLCIITRLVNAQLDLGADEATINKEVDRKSGPFKVTKEIFVQVVNEAQIGLFLM